MECSAARSVGAGPSFRLDPSAARRQRCRHAGSACRVRSAAAPAASIRSLSASPSTSHKQLQIRRGRKAFEVRAEKKSGASATSSDTLALPENFDLERAILLAGFAFEAYNQPKGGLKDSDVSGGCTFYFSPFVKECFQGVLEVRVVEGRGLASADITGKSDPYVVVSVGESSARTSTKLFTLDPKWNETVRLYVRDPEQQVLRLRVMDADLVGGDDDIGVAALPLKGVLAAGPGAKALHRLPVQDAGGGKGGGEVEVEVKYLPFTPLRAAAQAAAAAGGAGGVVGSVGAQLLSAALSAVARASEALQAESRRREWERDLWTVPPEGSWSVLAADSRPSSMPTEFEKVCFVENTKTDTQAAVWRNSARRQVVVAFRGTEMAKLKDIATDARLAPRPFNAERVGSGGFLTDLQQPQVHEGFLEAFDSVRLRAFRALDDAMGAGAGAAAGAGKGGVGEGWSVFVCGHSLGGALATLFAAELGESITLGRRKCKLAMYNYGSPRVGNRAFVDGYNRLVPDSVRVVNGSDAVVTVPALLGYRHVQHGVRVCPDRGTCEAEPLPAKLEGPAQSVAALAEQLGASGIVDQQTAAEAAVALAALVDSSALEAHFEDKYLVALRAALQRRGLSGTSRGE